MLQVFEDRVFRKVFGPDMDEVGMVDSTKQGELGSPNQGGYDGLRM
jgi:hypothetical protein